MTTKKSDCLHLDKLSKVQSPVTKSGYRMEMTCTNCQQVINPNVFPATTVEGFIRRWLHDKLTDIQEKNGKITTITQTKMRNYFSSKNKLVYAAAGRNVSYGEETLALIFPNGIKVANASKLERCGSYRKGVESPAQQIMQKLKIAMLPFNVFEEAELDILKAEIVEQGKSEMLTVPKLYWDHNRGRFIQTHLWDTRYNKKKKPSKKTKYRNLTIEKEDIYDKNGRKTKRFKLVYTYDEFVSKNLEKRHFVGAMLLKINNEKGKDKYFLFDCDRNELKHYNFNPFLTQLPKEANTIEEAYKILKPKKVYDAEKKGLKILRQGEWFFIPTKTPKKTKLSKNFKIQKIPKQAHFDLDDNAPWNGEAKEISKDEITHAVRDLMPKYEKQHLARVHDFNKAVQDYLKNNKIVHASDPETYAIRGQLQAGDNRPNNVEKYLNISQDILVKGKVTDSGREHEPITLEKWHIAIPNTAIKSFTITGAID